MGAARALEPRVVGTGAAGPGARCGKHAGAPTLRLVVRDEVPFHAYVAGEGDASRLLRRTLHRAGGSVEIGRCVTPEALVGSGYPDVLFLTDARCVSSMRCVYAWAADHGVALIVVQETEVADRLRLFDAGVDDVWDASIDPDEAGARVRRLVRRLRQHEAAPNSALD